ELLGLLRLLAAEAGIAITREDLRRSLADQARKDPLTGLGNRRVWTERLDFEIARSRRADAPLAIALLDLDFFKRFNDSYGHPAGDELLRRAAAAWLATVRPTDLLARLGGEEFGVILPGADGETAAGVLNRLRGVVPSDQSVSIGVTLYVPGEDADRTMHRADQALYAAKAAGRDQVVAL
ncbi:MAG TPA: GGDEF domain-containing protein, partial [Micromonosporaceae bacterium]